MRRLAVLVALTAVAFVALEVPAQAWETRQSATSTCTPAGQTVAWSFTNADSRPIGLAVDDGYRATAETVAPGETATGTDVVSPSDVALPAGTVTFSLAWEWADGTPGTDLRTAVYPAAGPCAETTTTVPATTTPPTTPPTSTPPAPRPPVSLPPTPGPTLPVTGTDGAGTAVVVAFVALAAGGAALAVSRRRTT